ncbi:MAG: hypothetical protein PHF63_00985 [Herbinix sp.]|nr:hypothetical protein [Herbinix sp.]
MRTITEAEKNELLKIKIEDLDFNKIIELLGNSKKGPPRFTPEDRFKLKANEYFNDKDIETTVGRFIYNKYLIEKDLKMVVGYVNEPITKKSQHSINNKIGRALLNDEIDVDTMVRFLDRLEFISKRLSEVICGSFTPKTVVPLKKVIDHRDKLLEENKEKLEKGDVITAVKIEKELVKMAQEELKGDPGIDLYDSGARGSFANNYKNNSIMKGPVFNPTTGQWDIVTTSFMEGLDKKDMESMGNSVITGAYPKAIGTAIAGYFSKQIIAALQAVTLDKIGSECNSKSFLKITISDSNKKLFMYRNIISGTKLIQLNESNLDSYVGKEVKMRSPMFNGSKKLCRVCAGDLYTKLDIDHIGLTAARVASTMLNLKLKKFHDSSAKIATVDVGDMFI